MAREGMKNLYTRINDDVDDVNSSKSDHNSIINEELNGNNDRNCHGSKDFIDNNNVALGNYSRRTSSNDLKKLLDTIYEIINELYDEEIIPSLHEIRRKLQCNNGLMINGENLLKICIEDVDCRFDVKRLNNDKTDIHKDWIINIYGKCIEIDKNEIIDLSFIKLLFQYIIYISTYKYYKCNNKIYFSGRYLYAKYLKYNGPHEFKNLSIGFIIKIIQKSIDLGILVYNDNNLIPIVFSYTIAYRFLNNYTSCYNCQLVRDNILKLIFIYKSISLCTLPILYKQHYNIELNYNQFGYTKLIEFIKLELNKCKLVLIDHHNYHVRLLEDEDGDEDSTECDDGSLEVYNIKTTNSDDEIIESIIKISNIENTTILYPFKITRIKY